LRTRARRAARAPELRMLNAVVFQDKTENAIDFLTPLEE
jgi:hypothetical protein